MIATVNTKQKTITIESSFKHPEWIEFFNSLPDSWKDFIFEIGTGEKQVPVYPYVPPITWTYGTGDPNPYNVHTTSCCGGGLFT